MFTAAAGGAWFLILGGALHGEVSSRRALLLLLIPAALTAWAAVDRRGFAKLLWRAAAITGVSAAAVVAAIWVPTQPAMALALPALAVTAIACARFPAGSIIAVFFMTGASGSINAFTAVPSAGVVDLLLAGCWLGVLWGLLFTEKRRPAWVWPGVATGVIYLAITLVQVLTAESLSLGFQAFRASAWYMMAFLLVAYAPWSEGARGRVAKGIVLVALAVGAYACLRLIIGAAPQEQTNAIAASENPVRPRDLGLLGSFSSGRYLAGWCAIAIPFLVGFGLARNGKWRTLSLAAILMCTIALFGAGVRAPVAGTAIGVTLMVVLYQFAQAFRGVQLGATATVAVMFVGFGLAGYYISGGGAQGDRSRYGAIFHPSSEPSFQARLTRWDEAMGVIPDHPLGIGLGSVGGTHKRFASIRNLDTNTNLDSTYLKVALEQGITVFALFVATLLLLLIGLGRRAIASLDRTRAAMGIGACGVLATMMVEFYLGLGSGSGRLALAGWLLVGFGVSHFIYAATGEENRSGTRPT